jgi:uncharacterized protein YmfQ (DUF2313 family)
MRQARTAQEWAGYYASMMPPGEALDLSEGGLFWHTFQALGFELARFDSLVDELIAEADPSTTTELIGDWERMLALPRVCQTPPVGLALRRSLVLALLTRSPDLSPQMLIDALAVIGADVTIKEYFPESVPGDLPLSNRWKYDVTIAPDWGVIQEFEIGLSQTGDPLGTVEAGDLDCFLDELEPAYAERTLIFA